jgi:SAM-dependent methyltransferase
VSPVGTEKIERFAREAGVKVRVRTADIQKFELDETYDVVVCNGVLHYVEHKQRVIELMQNATWPGGINVISLWSDYTPVPEYHKFVPVYADRENGVVTSSYRKWRTEFIYYERDKGETSHSDLPAHRHSHIKLIASKP